MWFWAKLTSFLLFTYQASSTLTLLILGKVLLDVVKSFRSRLMSAQCRVRLMYYWKLYKDYGIEDNYYMTIVEKKINTNIDCLVNLVMRHKIHINMVDH